MLMRFLSSYSTFFLAVFQLLNILVFAVVLLRRDHPTFKLSWLIVIMIFPLVGGAIYLFCVSSVRRNLLANRNGQPFSPVLYTITAGEDASRDLAARSLASSKIAEAVKTMSTYPVFEHTAASYFESGEAWFPTLLEKLGNAEKFIFMEYFLVEPGKMFDPIMEILTAKAQKGVEVRFMFDDLGCLTVLPGKVLKKMVAAGIKLCCFNPVKPQLNAAYNYRDHRKICVIDAEFAFCGGLNLADEYINVYSKLGYWKDSAVMLEGSAVDSFCEMFLSMWDFVFAAESDHSAYLTAAPVATDGFVQPFTDLPASRNNVTETAYRNIFGRANDYIYITTPYLIIHDAMIDTLILAAKSGVDVRIITPAIGDKWYVHGVTRSNYATLLEGGVRIFEFTPGFVHAKMLVCDDSIALVGTTNMDFRTFYLHCECACLFYHSSVVGEVKRDIDGVLEQSHEITLEHVKKTPWYERVFYLILRLFSPLM